MKKNIRVSRYNPNELPDGSKCNNGNFLWEASVQPEDGTWVLFVPTADALAGGLTAQLWHRIGTTEVNGATEEVYAVDGSEEHRAYREAMPKAS